MWLKVELSLVQRRGLLQNEEVEVAFREYLLMRQSDLYRYGNFKLVANWGKCINVLGVGGCCLIFVLRSHLLCLVV